MFLPYFSNLSPLFKIIFFGMIDKMEQATKKSFLDKIFKIAVALKGVDGFFETIGGFLLFFISQATLNQIVLFFVQPELIEDSNDLISNYLVNLVNNLSVSTQNFIAAYLICHGIVKIFLIFSLLKNKHWAYPVSAVFFIVFIIYGIYRYFLHYSALLLFLTIFDIFIVILILLEYKKVKKNNLSISA